MRTRAHVRVSLPSGALFVTWFVLVRQVIFLNQLVLRREGDESLAKKLIGIYFSLFEQRVGASAERGGRVRKTKPRGGGGKKALASTAPPGAPQQVDARTPATTRE